MAKRNLMGFKKVSGIPPAVGRGPRPTYDQLIAQVSEEKNGIYMIDTCDKTRAKSLTATLRNSVRRMQARNDVIVMKRGTEVYVVNVNCLHDINIES